MLDEDPVVRELEDKLDAIERRNADHLKLGADIGVPLEKLQQTKQEGDEAVARARAKINQLKSMSNPKTGKGADEPFIDLTLQDDGSYGKSP